MKNYFKKSNFIILLFAILVITIILSFACLKHSLIGRWTSSNPDVSPTNEFVTFYQDGSYDVSLPNGQIGERGFYKLKDSVFSIKNAKDVCGKDYWGSYSLTFYGEDSIHFSILSDTCSERRMDIVGYNPGLRRAKSQ